MLVTFGICFKHFDTRYFILTLGIWRSAISQLPGCFCPWTFFQKIGFNMVPSDSFVSHLATQLRYFAGEFQALQLINHLPPVCLSTFRKSTFRQQLGCRFDIMDCKSSTFLYFDICNCRCLNTSYDFFLLYLYLLYNVLYFYQVLLY